MMKSKTLGSPKQKFIEAAMEDIREFGVTQLSMRRVAQRCGMSSGAAYKHFSDRNELMLEVYRTISESWEKKMRTVIRNDDSARRRLTEVSVAYVEFLCENPLYQTIIMLNDSSLTAEQREEKARITDHAGQLIDEYCADVQMDEKTKARKTYAVRAFIYGAAVMVNSGQLPFDGDTLEMVRRCIDREFDLS